ncbi:MAG: phage tail tip lysozyme, partial [Paracoccaceae bacterium]
MQQPGFIFGGNTDWSYDELQRKRQIAENLRMANMRTPQNVGEGLSAIGRALAARKLETQSGQRDAELREEFNRKWGALLGGGVGGSPAPQGPVPGQPVTSAPVAPANPNDPAGIAGDAMVALGKAPDADMIRAKLVERGLPPAVAEGFVMNFNDESGLNPGINEIAPVVPGSRGGFGLAQWTGPRRVALEKFAAERGLPVDNVDVQLDFLMTELQGPEAGAWSKISGAQDPGSAAAAIATHFLRPAEEHLDRRVASYTGGQQGGMDPMMMAEIMGSPYASEGQKAILSALLNQQLQAADPVRQLELEKARLELDAMRNPRPEAPKPTDDMREYEFARSQGYQGTFQDFMIEGRKAGATVVNTGGMPVEPLGTEGQILVPDP